MPVLLALSTAAFAEKGGFEVGAGPRANLDAWEGSVAGLHAFGRYGLTDALTAEVGAIVNPFAETPSPLAEAMVQVKIESNPDTTFRAPVMHERAGGSAGIDWSFGPRPRVAGVTGGLHVFGGIEVRLVQDAHLGVDEGSDDATALVADGSHVAFGPALGVGLDAWFGERVGARWVAFDRFAVEREPDFGDRLPDGTPVQLDAQVTSSLAFSLDLVVAL